MSSWEQKGVQPAAPNELHELPLPRESRSVARGEHDVCQGKGAVSVPEVHSWRRIFLGENTGYAVKFLCQPWSSNLWLSETLFVWFFCLVSWTAGVGIALQVVEL